MKFGFVAAIVIAAVSLSMSPIAARADEAAGLLAKHKAFVGWQFGDGSVQSLYLERSLTNDKGAVIQTAIEHRLGLAYRRDFEYNDKPGGSTGFTTSLFWTTSSNGFTVPMVGNEAKQFLIVDALFMEATTALAGTLQGPGTVNGKPVQIVRVAMGGALPMDLYIDPDTGAYLRAVADPGGDNEETINIDSYATLGKGKKMIGTWSFDKSTSKYSYTKLVLNPLVSASELHPPNATATWAFANPKPFPIKVTDTRVYVDATVNGVPGRFILDTGASTIALFDEFAERAKLKTIAHTKASGIGGTTDSTVRRADAITIGGNTLSNVVVQSVPTKFHDRNENPDGLMGFDVFGGAVVNLNLSNSTMTISDPATTAVDPSIGYRVTPDLQSFTPTVPMLVGDKVTVNVLLDTGANSLILLSRDLQNHGVPLLVNQERTFLGGNAAISGVGGSELVLCGRLPHLTLGPITYGDITGCESSGWALHNGLVGFDFLKHFDYVFDYPHGQMFMTPHKDQ